MNIPFLQRLYGWYGTTAVRIFFALAALLLVVGLFFTLADKPADAPSVDAQLRTVSVRSVAELSAQATFSAIGTVSAVSEARLQTEASGRITSVAVGIGDRVVTGQVLAQIENAAERAALLQAEGAYEAALVGGTQSGISLADAQTNALNTYRTAFTTVDDTIRNLTDELFSNPTTVSVGLRLDSQGQAPRLNAERIAFGALLESWAANVSAGDTIDVQAALTAAERDLLRVGAFVSDLSLLLAEQDVDTEFTSDVIASYKTRLSAARSRIDGAVQSVTAAEAALLQAEQAASGNVALSAADARVKQSLGALRIAEANYEKTLVRTPISGVVNAVTIKANEYVGQSADAITVANNDALEITTFVGDTDRSRISIGDTVTIEGGFEGRIARIAPAVNPDTKKVEVKIQTDAAQLENGSTVRVHFETNIEAVANESVMRIPLTAIKLTSTNAFVFSVVDGELVAHTVTLGKTNGQEVEVESGLTRDMMIVTDARGLNAGQRVNLSN